MSAARETDLSATSQTDVSAARQTDVSAARQTDVSAARQTDVSAARQTDVSAARQTDVSAARQTDVSAARQTDVSAARQTDVSAARQTDVSAARQTDVSVARQMRRHKKSSREGVENRSQSLDGDASPVARRQLVISDHKLRNRSSGAFFAASLNVLEHQEYSPDGGREGDSPEQTVGQHLNMFEPKPVMGLVRVYVCTCVHWGVSSVEGVVGVDHQSSAPSLGSDSSSFRMFVATGHWYTGGWCYPGRVCRTN